MKVCVVESAKFPSDQPFSTHAIQPAGMDFLDELGVGNKIRERTAVVSKSRFSLGRAHVDVDFAPGREMHCPRRSLLDPVLQEAAIAAGADFRPETAVLELLRDGDRVAGVRTRHGGKMSELRARIIIGADGRHSTVARLVKAEQYLTQEFPRGGYWSYWPSTTAFETLPFQTYIEIDGHQARFAFRCDGALTIAGALDRPEAVRAWKPDIVSNIRRSLLASKVIRLLVDGNEPVAPPVGLLKASGFFRVPVGPGWALVGDAGLHKDPTPGYGITDALRDAKSLSRAVLDGREAALELYWRERDVKSLALFANAQRMGSLEYANPFNELIIAGINATPALRTRLRDVMDRKVSPFDVVPFWRIFAWTALAMVKGQTEIWPHFLESGKFGSWLGAELGRRKALLEQVRGRIQSQPSRAV